MMASGFLRASLDRVLDTATSVAAAAASRPALTCAVAAGVVWVGTVRCLRYRNRDAILAMAPIADQAAVAPVLTLTSESEFPWSVNTSVEFGLFMTFGIPSISRLLHKTREFEKRCGKRYDDTDLILKEMVENGLQSKRGQAAIQRLNKIHAQYGSQISNDDMLYTLVVFIVNPVEWINRLEWRSMTQPEQDAVFLFFRDMGEQLGIRNIPSTFDACRRWKLEYESLHWRYQLSNRKVADATLDMFLSSYPTLLQPAVYQVILSQIPPQLRQALGYPAPLFGVTTVAHAALLLRAAFVRYLMPPRPVTGLFAVRRTPTHGIVQDVDGSGKELKPSHNDEDWSSGAQQCHDDPTATFVPRHHKFGDRSRSCLAYEHGYTIDSLGPATCPAGLSNHTPSYP
eukprot:m.147065 g.147065  ORF g.147065 m.147065 type:complete len:399 (+) comp17275_c0_seq3:315-1511(+)